MEYILHDVICKLGENISLRSFFLLSLYNTIYKIHIYSSQRYQIVERTWKIIFYIVENIVGNREPYRYVLNINIGNGDLDYFLEYFFASI